ncbi:MAG: glycosyltransferase family 2 protein, partial [Candidatus Heimdallarchaeota archaeon]
MKLSAMVLCYNEENYIGYSLESLSFVDEIVICDGGSYDRTPEIITKFRKKHPNIKVKLFVDPKRDNYSYLRNQCLKKMTGDYCVML